MKTVIVAFGVDADDGEMAEEIVADRLTGIGLTWQGRSDTSRTPDPICAFTVLPVTQLLQEAIAGLAAVPGTRHPSENGDGDH